jgi:hypothetical protein
MRENERSGGKREKFLFVGLLRKNIERLGFMKFPFFKLSSLIIALVKNII